ncbi:Flp family type IVb pilin [Bordetella genomosp. 13]|uniref:Flp family type IVb pilin n=1 Tax=Bordetella genomosp. 13 TaxID=463040 RepID=UPI0011A9A155|nr:Flp family type IVb pilin [Bordetella genomosp. 13]
MYAQVKNFWQDEEGASAIEYGLIAGLIAVAIIAVLTTTGTSLSGLFTRISNALNSTAPAAPSGGGSGTQGS